MRSRIMLIGVNGGAEEDRTPDLRIANATLSQLSYGPFGRPDSTLAPGQAPDDCFPGVHKDKSAAW